MEKTKMESINLGRAVLNAEQERSALIDTSDVKSIQEYTDENAKSKFNEKVDEYVEKLNEHEKILDEYKKKFVDDLNNLEIVPLYEGVIIKPFGENPFQQIKREGNLIVDTGGLAPRYKSTETGQWEEEEQFIHVGLVIEVGPTAKYVKSGDVVMWRKPSETPIPFYKQGFVLVNEHSIITVINENLTERFNSYD